MIGIYKITNSVNGKVYIGQSINISLRWEKERKGKSNDHLRNAFKKYGLDKFEFSIIAECGEPELNELEIYWIKHYDSTCNKYGYNKDAGGSKGIPCLETRLKMSISAKNAIRPPMGAETKLKLSITRTGMRFSDEIRLRMKNAQSNRSEEVRLHMSEAHKGKPSGFKGHTFKHTPEAIEKIRIRSANCSDITREKLRQKAIEQWARKKLITNNLQEVTLWQMSFWS